MSDPIGTYTFLPWMRRGIASRIANSAADTSVKQRAAFDVEVTIDAVGVDGAAMTAAAPQHIELYGPGDIIGLDATAISRVEPTHWTTNFEPNYLAAIEFYDEDLPWRYTPAAPAGRRLSPWLALIVLSEDEFRDGGVVSGRPLPHIEMLVDLADVAPPPDELWAWAHVHFNESLTGSDVVSTDVAAIAGTAESTIAANPDLAYSRLLCPRKLVPATAYHAFVIPAYESGRIAGLGMDPGPVMDDPANGLHASFSAWGTYGAKPASTHVPVYHRWYFRTGARGDFEELVRILEPKIVDSRVGARDIDVSDPAPNLDGIDGPDANGILRLGGALRAPLDTLGVDERAESERFDEWAEPLPHVFQQQLAAFLNLPDAYAVDGAAANTSTDLSEEVRTDPDPVVVPPIYGRWHALTERLLTERDGTAAPNSENWVHDLNLDPRWRTAAGFGTTVVQDNQETYMDAAWDQVGSVIEANARIRQAQLASRTSLKWHRELTTAPSAADTVTLYGPMHSRVVRDRVAVRYRVKESPVGEALLSTTMRRTLRPRGRLAAESGLSTTRPLADIVDRVNRGELVTAPPKPDPEGVPTRDDLADALEPSGFLADLAKLFRRIAWLGLTLVLVLAALLVVLLLATGFHGAAVVVAVIVAVVALLIGLALRRALQRTDAANSIREDAQTPESIDALPGNSAFTLVSPISLSTAPPVAPASPTGEDNPVSTRFKTALRSGNVLLQVSEIAGRPPVLTPLDLDAIATDITVSTDPRSTVPAATFNGITLPGRILEAIGERFVEAMAYPEFDIAMYRPLVDMDVDGFVPNLHLVEPNSVTLLETNQRFIESYMVGLNHEFARELLWREFPTDQRGSYFRQFWDVRTQLALDADEAAREDLKDIPPLHLWSRSSDLGDHDHREAGRDNEEELVLVVRGELLKKYPNTIVSAQKARWQPKSDTDPTPDKAKERRLDEDEPVMMPLYEARVAPDIYFFGFDLTALEARGDDTVDDKPGFFFRIEEVPGDAAREGPINVYNDLSWADIVPGVVDGALVKVATIPSTTLVEPTTPDVQEKHEQWESDRNVPLDANVSAAELAYVALQTPVLMAVHASELLPDQE